MIKVYNNGKYFFFTLNNKDVTLPLPGDLFVSNDGDASIILNNSFYERDGVVILELSLATDEKLFLTRGGSAKPAIASKKINFLTNVEGCRLYRGIDRIYPIGPIYKLRNKITKFCYWGVDFFKKLKSKIGL